MTQTLVDPLEAGDLAIGAPLHCGESMTLRETSYTGVSYGMISRPATGVAIDLVWACACGFQLSHEDCAPAASPLSTDLRRIAAASADLELAQWRLDRTSGALEATVVQALDHGLDPDDVAVAAQLHPDEVRRLAERLHSAR